MNDWREKVYRVRKEDELSRDDWNAIRAVVFERDNHMCQRCEKQSKINRDLTVHHIVPRSEDGYNNLSNLITLCNKCHDDVEMEGCKTIADIIAYDNSPVHEREIKESLGDDIELKRPDWHAWVYGGAKRH